MAKTTAQKFGENMKKIRNIMNKRYTNISTIFFFFLVLPIFLVLPNSVEAASVQHGTTTIGLDIGTVTITLDTPVDVGRSVPIVSCAGTFNSPSRSFCRASLITEVNGEYTQLEIYRGLSGFGTVEVTWQVIENEKFTVQTGLATIETVTLDVAINEVNLNSSFIIVSSANNSGHSYNGPTKAKFNSSTEINLAKGAYGSGIYNYVRWYVVEWSGASVQSDNLTLSGSTSVSDTITEIDLNKSFLLHSYTTDQTNFPARVFPMGQFTSNTNVQFIKDSTSGVNLISYFVVTHDDLFSQRGNLEVTGTSNTATISSVSTSTTFLVTPNIGNARQDTDVAGYNERFYNTHTLTDSTTVTVARSDSTGTLNAYWQAVSLEDVTNPTISILSPADNATGVAVDANLVITFTEAVDVETGNINIHKTSDNTLIEAIDVTGGLVTGNGTATITINPTNSLVGETEYYVLIDATAFDDTAGNSFAGIADTTTWSFTSADIIAPEISNPLPSGEQPAGTTAVTLSVSTNEVATCKYSTISGTAFADMTAFTITGATSHSTDVLVNDGENYDYYVLCQDVSLNESIEVAISFSVAETPSPTNTTRSSGGASVQAQVQNLNNMGNTEAANKLIQQYAHLFAQTASIPTTPTQTINTPNTNSANISSTKELQRFLNTNGFPVALSGPGALTNETDIFGNLTRQALAKFQLANGISPAVGFFGPITKAFIANMNTEAPTTAPVVVPFETPITEPLTVAPTETSVIPRTVRDLTVGMEGTDVIALQQLLIAQGYSIPAGATGYFGQQTKSALSNYQAANNIAPAVGYFGTLTQSQMKSAGLEGLWW